MLACNEGLEDVDAGHGNSMTDAELSLWSKVRRRQLNGRAFYRRKNIGNYIVDFYCPSAGLIVELDGGHHLRRMGMDFDRLRDDYLKHLGFKVFRFSDVDVFINMDGIIRVLYEHTKVY